MAPQFAVGRSLRSEPATDEDAMSDDTTSLGNVIRIQLKLGKHVPMGHRPALGLLHRCRLGDSEL